MTVKTAQKLLAQFPNAAVYNTYGPTEATGAVTQIRVTSELLEKVSRVPLGYAKPGVHVEIIDQELIIIGDSVAKGYFENPEKTQAAFFEYHNEPAYHSGDAGSVDEDGLLHYQGRLDFQVKFNGFRIELQDIEAHLLGINTVEKAIVLPKLNENHKVTALIAVLQSTERFPDKKAERAYTKGLKKELLKTVMDYMIPTQFVYQSDFPLTNNGKIDRKRLTTEILGG
ncbi:AMP-binding protein [Lactococcus fujiensis]|uniref:AMP-binding protein n=1 Tax=Lactococcus fujiensis TaxID=610251 RepID=UPI000ADA36A2|nr:AMP-binding protein [Lactococcus fujiensis]